VVGGTSVIAKFSSDWVRLEGLVFDFCELTEQFRCTFCGFGVQLWMLIQQLIGETREDGERQWFAEPLLLATAFHFRARMTAAC
jgi:hypothetical protein